MDCSRLQSTQQSSWHLPGGRVAGPQGEEGLEELGAQGQALSEVLGRGRGPRRRTMKFLPMEAKEGAPDPGCSFSFTLKMELSVPHGPC